MFVNYSVTELPEHLKKGGIPPFFMVHPWRHYCLLFRAIQLLLLFQVFSVRYGQFFCTVHCKKSDNTGKYTKLHYFIELL